MSKQPTRFLKDSCEFKVSHLDRMEAIKASMGCAKKDVLNSALDIGLAVLENPNLMIALLNSGVTLSTRD